MHTRTGWKLETVTDFAISKELGLSFSRHYSSYSGRPKTRLGRQWRHSLEREVHLSQWTASATASVFRPNGNQYFFNRVGSAWVPEPDVTGQLQSIEAGGVITGWLYREQGSIVEHYDVDGHLIEIDDGSGHSVMLTYLDGLLDQATDQSGRSWVFSYSGSSRLLTTIVGPGNAIYRFTYNASNVLQRVYYPDFTPADPNDDVYQQYHYENAALPYALTGITDEKATAPLPGNTTPMAAPR